MGIGHMKGIESWLWLKEREVKGIAHEELDLNFN
jgi:hypothetical protein